MLCPHARYETGDSTMNWMQDVAFRSWISVSRTMHWTVHNFYLLRMIGSDVISQRYWKWQALQALFYFSIRTPFVARSIVNIV